MKIEGNTISMIRGDSESLSIRCRGADYGVYRYDVQLTDRDGRVTTILPPADFILRGEVTYE